MIKREFKARIVADFKQSWIEATAANELTSINDAEKAYTSDELDMLHERIAGKEVTMLEMTYPVGDNDFFEKEDNNFVMHHSLWVEI